MLILHPPRGIGLGWSQPVEHTFLCVGIGPSLSVMGILPYIRLRDVENLFFIFRLGVGCSSTLRSEASLITFRVQRYTLLFRL